MKKIEDCNTGTTAAKCHFEHKEPYFTYVLQGNGLSFAQCQGCKKIFQVEAGGAILWRDDSVEWFTPITGIVHEGQLLNPEDLPK